MNEDVKKIRNDIVQKFCRTVLWIDDEIHLDTGLGGETNPLFKNKYDEFTMSGLLCHMMEFPEIRGDSDPYAPQPDVEKNLKSCELLALQSDIVIVDWMLGTTDSSEYAEKIVKQVVGQGKGFRFIVVLSYKEPEESKSAFKKIDSSFERLGENYLWKNESGQFLLSLRKDKFKDANLFDEICKALSTAYPDYLHLAALEIAGRIKELAPQWLSLLPARTDVGILVERAHLMKSESTRTTWRNDIQECVAANLLEDLTAIIMKHPLASLSEEMLLPSNIATGSLKKLLECKEQQVKTVLDVVNKSLIDIPTEKLTANQYKILSGLRGTPCVLDFIAEIEAYTDFCEKMSVCETEVKPFVPGKIYQHMFAGSDDIAVCVSAECDCARLNTESAHDDEHCQSLLFLRGEKMLETVEKGIKKLNYDKISKSGETTVLRFKDATYIFRHDATSMTVKPCTEMVAPIVSIGFFRHDILNRLADRYMSYVRRVGVNQPSIARSLRHE